MTRPHKNIYLAGQAILAGLILTGAIKGWFIFQERNLLARAAEKTDVRSFDGVLSAFRSGDFTITSSDGLNLEVSREDMDLWVEQYTRAYTGKEDMRIKPEELREYILNLATRTNRSPINAKLKFENGKASEFVKSSPGRTLNQEDTFRNITSAVLSGSSSAEAVYEYTEPEITLAKINQLGITSLIGRGESDFSGSSLARIHNIRFAASKYNGAVIPPGETFSFNDVLGEVSEAAGYQSELVIKNGELEREAGGGVCQVSTTLFRAAIFSGLPITERRPHSFAVRYYNPQGFDSTIYPGVVDLKFRNDTEGHIMLQSQIVGNKISFEIYGTDDGRKVSVTTPTQYDIEPTGAMKTYFTRSIEKNGDVSQERFSSIYKAPPTPKEKNPLE